MSESDQRAAGNVLQATLALALQRFRERRYAESEALYRRVLEMFPGHADALNMLGVVQAERGNPLLALKHIDEAIRIAPTSAAYLTNRGEIMRRWGLVEEGLAVCARAVELDPASPEARNNYGLALLGRGAGSEALGHFDAALELRPAMAEALLNRGRALKLLGCWTDAGQTLSEAVTAHPDYADAWHELANLQERLGDAEASVASCRRALALRPGFSEVWVALGDAYTSLRNSQEARVAYRRALEASPGSAIARYQLALCLLGEGEFAEGWALYESRFDPAIPGAITAPLLPMPMWQGEELLGKKLLVLTEQGYGDHIQFARFVPLVARRGADIVMGASPEMRELSTTLQGVARVLTHVEAAWTSGCDYWTFIGSLPLRLGVASNRIPAEVPYLSADPERARAWRERLGAHGNGLKVGLCWAGRPTHANDWRRSVPLACFASLGAVDGVVLYSVQTGERAAEAVEAPGGLRVVQCGPELRDFADTAALLAGLDLLISVDSAPAHLAGALGRPVWNLLPFQPDWRWRQDEDVSRWYPDMRLFRQTRPGDWDGVIARVTDELRRLAA